MVRISNCINGEARLYGLKVHGLIFASLGLIIIWSNSSMIFGIMGGSAGYFVGDLISKYWQKGVIQKYFYWNLYKHNCKRKSLLPSSSSKILL